MRQPFFPLSLQETTRQFYKKAGSQACGGDKLKNPFHAFPHTQGKLRACFMVTRPIRQADTWDPLTRTTGTSFTSTSPYDPADDHQDSGNDDNNQASSKRPMHKRDTNGNRKSEANGIKFSKHIPVFSVSQEQQKKTTTLVNVAMPAYAEYGKALGKES